MKIFKIARHAVLAVLVLTSVPLVAHFFRGKPQHEWITWVHVIIGLLFIVLSIVGTILNKKAGENTPQKG